MPRPQPKFAPTESRKCCCGADFWPKTPWQRFCSVPCRKSGTEADRKAKDSARQKAKLAAKRERETRFPGPARLVSGRDDLAVSRDGTAWSKNPATAGRWVRLKPFIRNNCAFVRIKRGEVFRTFVLAKLVLSTWVEPRPLGHAPFHFPDTDPLNNRADNLRWVPRSVIYIESNRSSRPPRNLPGARANNARLARDDIARIIRMYRAGEHSMLEIAERFCVGETTVHSVIHGRSYREESGLTS